MGLRARKGAASDGLSAGLNALSQFTAKLGAAQMDIVNAQVQQLRQVMELKEQVAVLSARLDRNDIAEGM
jgi:hypothetical protein